jgi:hypothetical protein
MSITLGLEHENDYAPVIRNEFEQWTAAIQTALNNRLSGGSTGLLLGLEYDNELPPDVRAEFEQLTAAIQTAFNQHQFIKSVQRGSISMFGTASNVAPMTAVDTANTLLRWLGGTSDDIGTTVNVATTRVELTANNQITGFCGIASGTQTVGYEVVEYNPGLIRSVQRGTVTSNGTATIQAVDFNRATIECLGWTSSAATVNNNSHPQLSLTNSTTVTATAVAGTASTVGFQVVDWL